MVNRLFVVEQLEGHQVADGHHADQLARLDDGQMTDATVRHDLAAFFERCGVGAGDGFTRHRFPDGAFRRVFTLCHDLAQDVALGEDSLDVIMLIGDHQRPSPAVIHALGRFEHGLSAADSGDMVLIFA